MKEAAKVTFSEFSGVAYCVISVFWVSIVNM